MQNDFLTKYKETYLYLYGLGKETEELLVKYPSQRINGVLDGFREEGTFCGKPILALESIELEDSAIIIVARAASEKIIYKRIKDFCKTNGISVYSFHERNIEFDETEDPNYYFEINVNDMEELISQNDIISFDIFDTILMRKISDRETIYKIIAEEQKAEFAFPKLRMQAELELSGAGCPGIQEIYDKIRFLSGCTVEKERELMERELSFEATNIIPRYDMIELVNKCAKIKPTYLISDMYFSKDYLSNILEKNGLYGYKELFVSCEYKTSKGKELFKRYKEEVEGEALLHIGDDKESDGLSASKNGLNYYLIKSSNDMADITSLGRRISNTSDCTKDLIFARAFNSPFALYKSNGKLRFDNVTDFGYSILGPILVGYVQWLIEALQEAKTEKIIFISRDGFIIKKIYDLLVQNIPEAPESVYLYISRKMGVISSLENDDDIGWANNLPFSGTIEEKLRNRFGLSKSAIETRKTNENDAKYLERHFHKILKVSGLKQERYNKYLNKFDIKNKQCAVFDFISTGTCQYILERALGTKLTGFYFQKIYDNDERKSNLDVHSFISPNTEISNYFLLENLIKEIKPSVIDVDSNGNILFGNRRMDEKQAKMIEQIQTGAVDFCKDVICMNDIGIFEDCQCLATEILPYVCEEMIGDCFNGWAIFDEFTNRTIK